MENFVIISPKFLCPPRVLFKSNKLIINKKPISKEIIKNTGRKISRPKLRKAQINLDWGSDSFREFTLSHLPQLF